MPAETIKMNTQINYFLSVWAHWELRLREGLCGDYPSPSAMIMSRTATDFKTKQYTSKTPYINELANHMGYVINQKLAKEKPKQADALLIKYVFPKQKISELLQERKIPIRTLDHRVLKAKEWLSKWIEQDEFFQEFL